MGSKSKIPKPPDLSSLAEASLASAKLYEQVAKDQLEWAKTTDKSNRDVLERVLAVQLPQMEEAAANARKDRERYESVYQPLEDSLVADISRLGSKEDQEEEAGRRIAEVRTQFDTQRSNALMELEGYGIDPSQTRHQALDMGFRANEAASAAFAANQGRKSQEQLGMALRDSAINIGRGMPGQVAQAQGIVNQTGGGAVGNAGNTTNAGVNAYGSGAQYGQMGMQGLSQSANIQSQDFGNQMQRSNAQDARSAQLMNTVGSLAGAAMKMNEGGVVPDHPTLPQEAAIDTIPAMVTPGEFVVPADVVARKGTEFFDKLIERFKSGGQYDQQKQERQGAIPMPA